MSSNYYTRFEETFKGYTIERLKNIISARDHEIRIARDMKDKGIDANSELREACIIKRLAEDEILNRNGAIILATSIGLAGVPLGKSK